MVKNLQLIHSNHLNHEIKKIKKKKTNLNHEMHQNLVLQPYMPDKSSEN